MKCLSLPRPKRPRRRGPRRSLRIRAALLLRLADRIEAEGARLRKLESDNTGKPLGRGAQRRDPGPRH